MDVIRWMGKQSLFNKWVGKTSHKQNDETRSLSYTLHKSQIKME